MYVYVMLYIYSKCLFLRCKIFSCISPNNNNKIMVDSFFFQVDHKKKPIFLEKSCTFLWFT